MTKIYNVTTHNTHIFLRPKKVCLFLEMCLFWVCLLWVGTVINIRFAPKLDKKSFFEDHKKWSGLNNVKVFFQIIFFRMSYFRFGIIFVTNGSNWLSKALIRCRNKSFLFELTSFARVFLFENRISDMKYEKQSFEDCLIVKI